MKEFEESLARAKKESLKKQIMILFSGLLVALLIFSFLLFSRGVNIKIYPNQAEKIANISITNGIGFSWGNKVYGLSNNIGFLIKADGYKIYQNEYLISTSPETIEVILEELPGKIELKIFPYSKESVVKVNDKIIKNSQLIILSNLNGNYKITVDHPLFLPFSDSYNIGLGEKKSVNITLETVNVNLYIETVPTGASVFLNEEMIGVSPISKKVKSNKYQIIIKAKGFIDINEKLSVFSDNLNLKKIYKLNLLPGQVIISADQLNSDIFINNIFEGKDSVVKTLPPGNHFFSITKDGFETITEAFRINTQKANRKNIVMKEIIGSVMVKSSPSAEIIVNGLSYGFTPKKLNLRAVVQNVQIKKKGFKSFLTNILPSSDFEKSISIDLKTNVQARLDESPVKYINSLGSQMKLILPGKFKLGSSLRESGRYANEVNRNVEITKPFYISSTLVTVDDYLSYLNKPRNGNRLPKTSIEWSEAAKFCNWLSKVEGFKEFYLFTNNRYSGYDVSSDGYRLPTESEWAWVVKYYNNTKETTFSWGSKMPIKTNVGNIAGNEMKNKNIQFISDYNDGFDDLSPVMSFPLDKSGLYDITGNAHEWMHDNYELVNFLKPSKNIELNRMGPLKYNGNVIRGSSWKSSSLRELRLSFRDKSFNGEDDIGFRVVRWIGE